MPNFEDFDSDNDTLPDAWESTNGLSAINSSDAAQDRDNDGQNNAAEFIEGTNPSSVADAFKVTSITRASTFALTISGKGGRRYILERSPQLIGGTWTTISTSHTLSRDATVSLIDPTPPATGGFYRVRVEVSWNSPPGLRQIATVGALANGRGGGVTSLSFIALAERRAAPWRSHSLSC